MAASRQLLAEFTIPFFALDVNFQHKKNEQIVKMNTNRKKSCEQTLYLTKKNFFLLPSGPSSFKKELLLSGRDIDFQHRKNEQNVKMITTRNNSCEQILEQARKDCFWSS